MRLSCALYVNYAHAGGGTGRAPLLLGSRRAKLSSRVSWCALGLLRGRAGGRARWVGGWVPLCRAFAMDKLRHSRRRGRGRCRLGCLLTRLFPRALLARARSEAEVKLGTKMRVNVWEGRQTMPGRMGRGGGWVGLSLPRARIHCGACRLVCAWCMQTICICAPPPPLAPPEPPRARTRLAARAFLPTRASRRLARRLLRPVPSRPPAC